MSTEPPLDELDLVRSFRAHLADVPPGVQARIEERLWQDVLVQEARLRGGDRRRSTGRGWRLRRGWSLAARQGTAAVAVTAAVLVFGFVDGRTGSQIASTQARADDPISTAMQAIGGGALTGSDEIQPTLVEGEGTAPLVAGTTMVVFEGGDTMPLSQVAAGPAAMSPAELELLPADERLLLGLLRAAGGTTRGHDADFEAFRLAASYLSDPRVPVRVRVALMRMLRVVDGIDVGGSAVDVFGRAGVKVARIDRASGLRQQYLLDADNGRLLEHREFVVAQRVANCPPGTVVRITAYDTSGFQVPQQDAPYGAWPAQAPECDPAAA